jgi:hypothetical protein
MPITRDIARSYVRPRAVVAEKLAAGRREDRVLAYLMGACVLLFVAQWPVLARDAHLLTDGPPLDARLGGALMGWLMIAPLFFYGFAALVHLLARLLRGKGTWYTARLGLFWTLLATAPLMLLNGLVTGFFGAGPEQTIVGVVVVAGFFWIWVNALIVTEGKEAAGV